MQEIIIANVKTSGYREMNLNKIYDPRGTATQNAFQFYRSDVVNPGAAGEGKLSVRFYTLMPGKTNYPYHQHIGAEEVYYVISGTGTLKTSRGNKIITEGDVIVIPGNENGAHNIHNRSDKPLAYLDVDTVDGHSVVLYPDTGKVRILAGDFQKSFKIDSAVGYLDGE